jgi:EAL domain-containing protein (putative c-di-GMP-specific phosphodiesterase class I)
LIGLGRALEITIVAQGVVSEAHAMALRALGCEYAQGPFLGHEAVLEPGDEPETESLWAPGTITTGPGIPGGSTSTP